ncbi:S-adenosyl-L-methionine-dependent methyltransferase [Trichoderma ceciliae]
MNSQEIYSRVSEHYSAAARRSNMAYGASVAQAFGYSEKELASIPKESNLGLSCGNPLAAATIKEGETIIDLGSGAGLDVFLAANKVGPKGRAIGVDMNKDMLAKAQRLKNESKKTNVEFIESFITNIPLASGIADCITSNCVINLVPQNEKQLVFKEIFRLLKPGGRVAISDILARRPLSEEIRRSISLYVGCIAGAGQLSEYEGFLRNAGFTDILITDADADLNVYLEADRGNCYSTESNKTEACCSDGASSDLRGLDLNQWAGSFKIYAVKAPDA